MTDIVERLRKRRIGEPWDYMMVEEAADEIERLRKVLKLTLTEGISARAAHRINEALGEKP